MEGAQNRNHSAFHNLILETTDHHSYHILRVTRAYPATAWEEAITEFHEPQEMGTFRSHVGGLATTLALIRQNFI